MTRLRRVIPKRRAEVKRYASYRQYKGLLREDFNRRCGYCDADDKYVGFSRAFHIDHFAPKDKFSFLETEYSNLVYSCPFCNGAKSNYWPTDCPNTPVSGSQGVVDPCDVALDSHLSRDDRGNILPKTPLGDFIFELLNLNLLRHSLLWKLQEVETQMKKLDEIIKTGNRDPETLEAFYELTSSYMEFQEYIGDNV